jgi:hypothetical protein
MKGGLELVKYLGYKPEEKIKEVVDISRKF